MSKEDHTQKRSRQETEYQQSAAAGPARSAGWSRRRWAVVGLTALAALYIMNILAGSIRAPWENDSAITTSVQPRSAGESRAASDSPASGAESRLPTAVPLAAPGASAGKTFVSVQANATGEIRLSSSTLAEGKAQFYEYADPARGRIGFFAVRDTQGAVRTAIDNCLECFHAHKGYTQRGQEMICGECGKGFPIAYLGEAAGDCHPIHLPSTKAGDEVVIKVADLVASHASGASDTAAAGSSASAPATRVQPSPTGEIRIALAALADGKAQFYEYANPFGGQVRFFAARDAQGALHAALDNCQDCFQARRGYVQRGPEMVCRNCGKGFPIASINKVAGGCSPIGLPFVTADDEIVIAVADLVALDASGGASTAAPAPAGRLRF